MEEIDNSIQRTIVDKSQLPECWPTNRHAPEFWEQLGRTVATFGFLEEALGKAIFAYTVTKQYETEAELQAAYVKWLPTFEKALSSTLKPLADAFKNAVCQNSNNTTTNIDELIDDIKKASDLRNVICHGSWRMPDAQGFSLPLFVNNQKKIFDTPINTAYLQQVQRHVAELACSVISTVTHMGYQFPGSGGPGKQVWNNAP
nr:hypothetical protein [uncultured Cohaesibacter sp.]